MAQAAHEDEAVNADSFLDIVASVVSVLIIMVMVTGLKIKHTPVDVPLTAEAKQDFDDLRTDAASEETLRGEVLKVADEAKHVEQETAFWAGQRDRLALAVTAVEHRLQGERQQIDQQSQQDSDLVARLTVARTRLDEIEHQRHAVESAPAQAVRLESYPTPLSKTVDGREVHFQLRNGRITWVPLEELIELAVSDAKRKVHKLGDRTPQYHDTVGPQDGFRGTYTIELHEMTAEESHTTGRSGIFVRLKRFVLEQTVDDLGEPVDQALGSGSQFHLVLSQRKLRDSTVTVWVYPDSFDAFRKIKKDLYQLGFPVAARPMPEGAPIAASAEGTKSTAE